MQKKTACCKYNFVEQYYVCNIVIVKNVYLLFYFNIYAKFRAN